MAIAVVAIALAGCGKPDSGAAESAEAPSASASGAKAAPETVVVDLAPIPLTLEAPKGTSVGYKTPDDDFKMVRIDLPDGKGLAIEDVSAGAQKTFALQKQKREGDKVLFPFKKWEKDEADRAILQFDKKGKTGYVGFVFKEVAGKQYVCSTAGLDGRPSVADVEKELELCGKLAAK